MTRIVPIMFQQTPLEGRPAKARLEAVVGAMSFALAADTGRE